jgi:protein-S-isoprenylcysteine O-methyltransferase Ste14
VVGPNAGWLLHPYAACGRGPAGGQGGPYRWVRHPGYAADLLMWLGFGLASRNGLVGGSIVLVMLTAYMRRIAAEEAMLVVHLGGAYGAYKDYMRETSRVLPRVY